MMARQAIGPIIVGFVLLAQCASLTADRGEGAHSRGLPEQAIEQIRSLGEKQPPYMEALIGRVVFDTADVVPGPDTDRAASHALQWMRTVVREKWLPADFDSYLTFQKDVVLKAGRTQHDRPIPGVIGDFVIAQYRVEDHKITLCDNGASLSIQVELSSAADRSDATQDFIRGSILKFLNVSRDNAMKLAPSLTNDGTLVYGRFEKSSKSRSIDGSEVDFPEWWWHRVTFLYTDDFLFLRVPERDGTELVPHAYPGLPRRF